LKYKIFKKFFIGIFFFQTSHILTWASINPVAALSYFASARLNQVANSYTIQFASRILYTTKSEALILYIPQLVQAVRYDEVKIIRKKN